MNFYVKYDFYCIFQLQLTDKHLWFGTFGTKRLNLLSCVTIMFNTTLFLRIYSLLFTNIYVNAYKSLTINKQISIVISFICIRSIKLQYRHWKSVLNWFISYVLVTVRRLNSNQFHNFKSFSDLYPYNDE